MFGALRGCQWPTLAIRRFLLYEVFLHEVGHLQHIKERPRQSRRRFAHEARADEFAKAWREQLWSERFDHPDPVHNRPSEEELELVNRHWREAHGEYRKALDCEARGNIELASVHYWKAAQIYDAHPLALEALGIFTYYQVKSSVRALGLLRKALKFDPALHDANLFLGLAHAERNEESEARRYLERAVRLSSRSAATLSVYARVLIDWGYYDEAQEMFRKALKKVRKCPFVLHNYKRFLTHEKNPHRNENVATHRSLFEEGDLTISGDRITTYSRGLTVVFWHEMGTDKK